METEMLSNLFRAYHCGKIGCELQHPYPQHRLTPGIPSLHRAPVGKCGLDFRAT